MRGKGVAALTRGSSIRNMMDYQSTASPASSRRSAPQGRSVMLFRAASLWVYPSRTEYLLYQLSHRTLTYGSSVRVRLRTPYRRSITTLDHCLIVFTAFSWAAFLRGFLFVQSLQDRTTTSRTFCGRATTYTRLLIPAAPESVCTDFPRLVHAAHIPWIYTHYST